MLKVGITGGIACGKSTVCQLFSFLGIPTYNSDVEARNLMQNSSEIRKTLIDAFGREVYLSDGSINKTALSKLVFEQPDSRTRINAIVHPAVQQHFITWLQQQNAPYSLFESALLYSSGSSQLMDFCITVHCPEDERIERLQMRDGISLQVAEQKIASQTPQIELIKKANALIRNSRHDVLMTQVLATHRWLAEVAQNAPVIYRCL